MSIKGEKGYIGIAGETGMYQENLMKDSRQDQIEKCLTELINLLGVKISNFPTKEIHDKANTEITEIDTRIVNICKSTEHALSLKITGYYITDEGRLYTGWWNSMYPASVEDTFKNDKCFQWLSDNIKGAKFLYILTTFWGCDHTKYYVFEYPDGSYRKTEDCYAIT